MSESNKGITSICGLWTANVAGGGVSTSLNDRTLDTLIQALQAERAKDPSARSRLMVWPNKFGKGDKDPTHKMVLLAPRPPAHDEQPSGRDDKPDNDDIPF